MVSWRLKGERPHWASNKQLNVVLRVGMETTHKEKEKKKKNEEPCHPRGRARERGVGRETETWVTDHGLGSLRKQVGNHSSV